MPTPVGPRKINEPIGRLGSFRPGARAPDSLGDRDDRLLLADHAVVQELLHLEQSRRLVALEPLDRHAGPHADHLGDIFLGDIWPLGAGRLAADAHLALDLGDPREHALFFVLQVGGQLILLIFDRGLALLAQRLQAAQRIAQRGRGGRAGHAHARRRLVDQVDRLVGQEAVGHIARREMRGGLDRVVGDLELMEIFVAALDAAQNFDRLLFGRLIDHHRLEAPLQRRVALDILAILIERGRADRLQLAARERRLEDIRRVERALGPARADDRMELVDEQDAAGLLDLIDHALEALLELAAILGAGHQRAHVQRHNPLALDAIGHIAGDDPLGQPLDNRRLADARLADQRRVVLGAARKNLDHAIDLVRAADHRIEPAGLGHLGQIGAQRVQVRRLALALAR